MTPTIGDYLRSGLAILSGLCSVVVLLLDRPVLFVILLLITIALLIWQGAVLLKLPAKTDKDKTLQLSTGSEAMTDLSTKTADSQTNKIVEPSNIDDANEKQWLDCAYCQYAHKVSKPHREITFQHPGS